MVSLSPRDVAAAVAAERDARVRLIADALLCAAPGSDLARTLRDALVIAEALAWYAKIDYPPGRGTRFFRWATNGKMAKINAIALGLPSHEWMGHLVCKFAGLCARICFSDQGWSLSRGIRRFVYNFEVMRIFRENYVEFALADLAKVPNRTVLRFWDGGDFLDADHARQSVEVVKHIPKSSSIKLAYCYTKLPFDFLFAPSCPIICVQSNASAHDGQIHVDRPHACIFPSHEAIARANYVDCSFTDAPILFGSPRATRIGLVYHGARKRKEELQRIYASTDEIVRRSALDAQNLAFRALDPTSVLGRTLGELPKS